MSRYKVLDQSGLNYLTLTTVGWIDVFTRQRYRDIVIDSLKFCQENKGLRISGYVIMSNHLHMIVETEEGNQLSDVMRDFKKFTANTILKSIQSD
jgi:putative transposase